jgi:acyl-CoA hydrolase
VDEFTLPGVLDASRLFRYIDETAAVSAITYTRVPMVTASFDAAVFAAPAYTGDIIRLEAGITGAGRSSLELGVKIFAFNPVTSRRVTVAQLYTVFVAVGRDGKPVPLPRRPVLSPERMKEYMERRRAREERRRWISRIIEQVGQLARGLTPF